MSIASNCFEKFEVWGDMGSQYSKRAATGVGDSPLLNTTKWVMVPYSRVSIGVMDMLGLLLQHSP